ncbi:MAG: sulfate transporter CysZ [Halothiobacillaceae bacterium]
MKDFFHGLRAPWRGLRQMWQPGLRRYVLIPLVINAILFIAAMVWLLSVLDSTLREWLPDWLAGLLYPVFALALGLLTLLLSTQLANLLATPFNNLLAQRVETLLGHAPDIPARPLWVEVWRTLGGEMCRLVYFLGWALALLVLGFVPILGLLAPFGWLLLGAWLMALQYLDYPLSLRGLDFPAQRRMVRRHLGFSLGFGFGAQLLHLLPGLNLLAMPACVTAACISWRGQEVTNSERP